MNDQNNRQQLDKSAGNIGNKFKVTRRRRRPGGGGGGAEHDEDADEGTKAEIESLAAASGFGRDASSSDNTANNNHQTIIADCQSRPGAYAVDGPDRRRISDVSGEVVLGLDGDAVTASSGNQQPGGGNRRWCTRSVQSVQSGQSGQESENSAVAEVRAALEAEREAAQHGEEQHNQRYGRYQRQPSPNQQH